MDGLLGFFFSDKKPKTTGLLELSKPRMALEVTGEPKTLSSQVLNSVSARLGRDVSKLNDFARVVSGVESSYGRNLRNQESTAKGIYQFTDDSFVTAKNRLKNILGEIPERILKAPTVLDLSPEDQRALFFAHLTEDKGSDARILKYLEGDSGKDLYIANHYKGVPDEATLRRLQEFFG